MRYTINEFIEDYERNSDQFYGFYDWFCTDLSLKKRAKSFVPKLKFLVKEGLLDGDKLYVWFKNNCPMAGSLYDDMRFSTINGEDFKGGIAPRTGYTNKKNKCSIWGFAKTNDKYPPLIQDEFIDWSTFKKEIKTNKALKEKYKNLWAV